MPEQESMKGEEAGLMFNHLERLGMIAWRR